MHAYRATNARGNIVGMHRTRSNKEETRKFHGRKAWELILDLRSQDPTYQHHPRPVPSSSKYCAVPLTSDCSLLSSVRQVWIRQPRKTYCIVRKLINTTTTINRKSTIRLKRNCKRFIVAGCILRFWRHGQANCKTIFLTCRLRIGLSVFFLLFDAFLAIRNEECGVG